MGLSHSHNWPRNISFQHFPLQLDWTVSWPLNHLQDTASIFFLVFHMFYCKKNVVIQKLKLHFFFRQCTYLLILVSLYGQLSAGWRLNNHSFLNTIRITVINLILREQRGRGNIYLCMENNSVIGWHFPKRINFKLM